MIKNSCNSTLHKGFFLLLQVTSTQTSSLLLVPSGNNKFCVSSKRSVDADFGQSLLQMLTHILTLEKSIFTLLEVQPPTQEKGVISGSVSGPGVGGGVGSRPRQHLQH